MCCYTGKPDSSQSHGTQYRGPRVYPSISQSVNGQQYENHVLVNGNTEPLTTLFCYHGFQWVRVDSANHTGFVSHHCDASIYVGQSVGPVEQPYLLTRNALQTGKLDALVGMEIHTNVTSTGSLTFAEDGVGSEVLTHINQMTRNSQLSNLPANIPTDCPTR